MERGREGEIFPQLFGEQQYLRAEFQTFCIVYEYDEYIRIYCIPNANYWYLMFNNTQFLGKSCLFPPDKQVQYAYNNMDKMVP